MRFRRLSTSMLRFRLDEEPNIDKAWLVQRFADLIEDDPDGCLLLVDGDEPVGMVTTTCYQTVGWIGWLYVGEKYRFQGFGERLMRKAVEYILSRGMKTAVLEAVVEAVSLYERIGFTRQFETLHYLLRETGFEPSGQVSIGRLDEDSLDPVSSFDYRFFGQDRSRIFRLMQDNPNFHGWVAWHNQAVVGLLFGTENDENVQVGPLLIDTSLPGHRDTTAALCCRAIETLGKPLRVRCPIVKPGREKIITRLGAEFSNYRTIRMYFGEEYELERDGTLSLGCPGKG